MICIKKGTTYIVESIKKGAYYSNFYGGALLQSGDYELIKDVLENKRDHELQTSELKWQKINHFNYKSYIEAIDTFMDFVQAGKIKVRIMFTDNRYTKPDLSEEQVDNEYLLLYYQFLKHCFGLRFLPPNQENHLELFLDNIPENSERKAKFKKYLYGIQLLPQFIDANIKLNERNINEVDSKKHIIMQYLDVVLGAMAYRLNKLSDKRNPETGKRGKRTLAKNKVYKHINLRIRDIYPNFNIGITTGTKEDFENLWFMPYRHWKFKAKGSVPK